MKKGPLLGSNRDQKSAFRAEKTLRMNPQPKMRITTSQIGSGAALALFQVKRGLSGTAKGQARHSRAKIHASFRGAENRPKWRGNPKLKNCDLGKRFRKSLGKWPVYSQRAGQARKRGIELQALRFRGGLSTPRRRVHRGALRSREGSRTGASC